MWYFWVENIMCVKGFEQLLLYLEVSHGSRYEMLDFILQRENCVILCGYVHKFKKETDQLI